MIRNLLFATICLALMAGTVSCDTPAGNGGGGYQGQMATDNGAVVIINGEPIPASELLAAAGLRQGLRQYIYFHNLRKIARSEGIVADPQEIDEHISLVKQRLTERGDTWEGYLGELSITENEYRSNIEESLLQDGIVEKRVGITDEMMRRVWGDQEEKVIDEYMSDNFLPESERHTVTFEMCHDILFLKVMRIDGLPVLGDLNDELLDTATFEITCMTDPKQAKLYEFLILESAKNPGSNADSNPEDKAAAEHQDGGETAEPTTSDDAETAAGVDTAVGG